MTSPPSISATLMDNTQFLYELQLASLEIATLAGTATMADDFRTFSLPANV